MGQHYTGSGVTGGALKSNLKTAILLPSRATGWPFGCCSTEGRSRGMVEAWKGGALRFPAGGAETHQSGLQVLGVVSTIQSIRRS